MTPAEPHTSLSIWRGAVIRTSAPLRSVRTYRAPGQAPERVQAIIRVVAEVYGVTVEDILSRKKEHTEARDSAMYHVRQLKTREGKPMSTLKIGRWFGRDHSSVWFAIERHKELQERAA